MNKTTLKNYPQLSSTPYISIILTNRNDGYGGDQEDRFRHFISYYAEATQEYPDVFEFIICDWNPPPTRPPLLEAYPWEKLGNVRGFTVPNSHHKKFQKSLPRQIFEYAGHNACIRRSRSPWILILNQDIYLSPKLIDFIGNKKMKNKYFYRADRVDFTFDFKNHHGKSNKELITYAKSRVFRRHMRPDCYEDTIGIDPDITPEQLDNIYTFPFELDIYDPQEGIIYGDRYQMLRQQLIRRKLVRKLALRKMTIEQKTELEARYFLRFGIHTNASGDFLLAPREALEEIHGFPEFVDFYMHTDGYGVIQLFCSGYTQAIFTNDLFAFHADHKRPSRDNEKYTYLDHALRYCQICHDDIPYQLNAKDWGLINMDFPIRTLNPIREIHHA